MNTAREPLEPRAPDGETLTVARNVSTRYLAIGVESILGLVVLPFNVAHLGASAYGQDLNEQAARWLLEAIELEPSDARPYLFLGKVQEVAKSEPQEWVGVFRRFVELQPKDAWAHYYYAVALEKQRRGERDFTDRETQLQKAIGIDPRFGDAYLKLGLLDEEKGELAKAVVSLQKAVEFTALPDEAHLRLAQVYRRVGETEKARRESELYEEVSQRKKEKLERERRELGEFVFAEKP